MDSTASASCKMTQFEEALTGKTHTQELPDWLFPHPATLTLHSQQEQQWLGTAQRCPQADPQAHPQACPGCRQQKVPHCISPHCNPSGAASCA